MRHSVERVVVLTSNAIVGKDLRWQLARSMNPAIPVIYFSRSSRITSITKRPTLLIMDPAMARSSKGQRLIGASRSHTAKLKVMVVKPEPTPYLGPALTWA